MIQHFKKENLGGNVLFVEAYEVKSPVIDQSLFRNIRTHFGHFIRHVWVTLLEVYTQKNQGKKRFLLVYL